MDRRLLDYLPPVLREVLEFQTINGANEPEISFAWYSLARVTGNQFLDSADQDGVAVWERELQIYPKDTDTLDARKARIKAKWNTELPYTMRWLHGWLQSLRGADNPRPTVEEYTLRVSLPSAVDYTTALDDLRQRIPANLVIAPTILLAKATSNLFVGSAVRLSIKQSMTVFALDDNGMTAFTDESGAVLTDERGKILYVEDTL